jgi:hypothetical protein
MSEPLNPVLYRLLTQKFGEIKIANEGCPAYFNRLPDPTNPKRKIIHGALWGEYYCVRCPFCNDHRPRLWINHRYGSEVEYGRRQLTHLAVCYNNNCTNEPGRADQLEQIIFGVGRNLRPRPLPIQPVVSMFEPQPVEPPGEIASLSDLPAAHPARVYLEQRRFDPDWLAVKFNIGVVVSANDEKHAACVGRLYIPIIYRNDLVGWQCRAVNPQSVPKYLNAPGMRKSALLYNYDYAAKEPYVIVVEGVPSVWRLGAAAVCLFGKSLSVFQKNLIVKTWPNKPVFLLLDNDARQEMTQARDLLQQHSLKVVPIELPDARDPADYSVDAITDMLVARATSAGILDALA